MTDLRVRAYQAGDAAAVADLINLVAETGGGPGGFAAAEIDGAVTHEVKDAATDTRVITDAGGRLVAAALVPVPPGGGHRVELFGAVHPDRRGAGIGRELLAWQLERAAFRHAEIAPDAEWLGQVAAGVDDTSAIRLYERLGFTVERYFLAMTAPTASPPPVAPPAGVRLTPYTEDQERHVYAVHSAAFRDLWGFQERTFDEWAAQTVRSETFRPELSRLALAGEEIVGYVLPYEHAVPNRVYIGQVGTAGDWRRRGVASALLADLLGAAGQAGYTHASLDADADNPTGAARVYTSVGFAVDHHIVAYGKAIRVT
jgi:ribosomal protein S18 acetylase RimI-like enzyme